MKVEIVDDPADPRVAPFREARDGQLRRRAGLFLAEGRLVVRRLLEASRFRARSLLLTPRALDDLRDLLAGDDAPP
ncbi:MAG: TrmH family RNA methyltransferase, partial [Candidatus Rokuibacteriota bacterium]